jgi:hypothetical protein
LNKSGKFDQHTEAAYLLLRKKCATGPISISNDEIAAQCGFTTGRQVKEYLRKLKKQGRIFVRLTRAKFNGTFITFRSIYTKPEINSFLLEVED